MTNKIYRVPNLAPTATDKIIAERRDMEAEAPSAPVTYTPDGIQFTQRQGDKLEVAPASINDLAKESGITSNPYKTNLADDGRHVSEKFYFNSEEFNELRRRLYTEHNDVFERIGGLMVYDPAVFVDAMNQWLGTRVQFDSWSEAAICRQFLAALDYKSRDLPPELATNAAQTLLLPPNARN